MQLVTQAIRQLRQQLQLADEVNDDPNSIKQDKKKVAELKLKISEYTEELEKMRGDLIREEMADLKNGRGAHLNQDELKKLAEENIERFIKETKE